METGSLAAADKKRPKLRWYQYSLRSLFVVTTLTAVVLGTVKWWFVVREERRVASEIRANQSIPERDKRLFLGWIGAPGWKGLFCELSCVEGELNFAGWPRPLEWESDFVGQRGNKRRVLVFGGACNTGVIVLCDRADQLLAWARCRRGSVFHSASLTARDGRVELTVDASNVGLTTNAERRGLYRFSLGDNEIKERGVQWRTD
jgi:hypothetical protein